jgi:hypothetical protein
MRCCPASFETHQHDLGFVWHITYRKRFRAIDEILVSGSLIPKCLRIRRPEDGNVTDRINEEAFGADASVFVESAYQDTKSRAQLSRWRGARETRQAMSGSDDVSGVISLNNKAPTLANSDNGSRSQFEICSLSHRPLLHCC